MKNINKILAVSFIAMLAVPAAQAKIVSETMLSSEAGHYSGTHTVQSEIDAKQDTISDLATIRSGAAKGATSVQSVTQGSANGTISVDGTNVAVKGLGSAAYTASTTYQTAANSNVAAGTYNKIAAGNAVNTNLVNLDKGIGEINTKIGTVTEGKTVVQMINDAQTAATPGIATAAKTGVVKGGGNVAIATDGTMSVDLSGKVDKTQSTKGGILTTNASSGAVEVSTTIASSKVSGLGSLATKSTVASGDITDGTIVNADIASNAAIDQSKINGLSTSLSGKVNVAQGTDNKDKVLITNATTGNVETTKFIHSDGYSANATDKDTTIPSVEVVEDIVLTAVGDYVEKDQTADNKNKAMITNASGQVVPVAITNSGSGFVTGVAISNGAITVSKGAVGAANVASGLVTGTAPITVSRNSSTGVYTVGATAGSVASGDTGLVNGGTVYTEVRPTATNNTTSKGYLAATTAAANLTNLDTAIKTIHPNTGEVKIPSGSETSSTLASIWVE